MANGFFSLAFEVFVKFLLAYVLLAKPKCSRFASVSLTCVLATRHLCSKMVPIQTLNLYLTLRFPSSTAYTDMAVYCLFCALVYPWLKFNVKFFFFCLLVCFFDCEMIFFPMNK